MGFAGSRALVPLGFALVLAAIGCGQGGENTTSRGAPAAPTPPTTARRAADADDEVLATYAGRTLTVRQAMWQLESLAPGARTFLGNDERKRRFLESVILNDLLFEEGRQLGYDQDPDLLRRIEEMRRNTVINRVIDKYRYPKPVTFTDEQVRRLYDENPALFSDTKIHVSHILLQDEPTAREILAEVKGHPERFAEAARRSTDKATAENGGDLGWIRQGKMSLEFERAAFALQPGQVSDLVKSIHGYDIILVTEREDGPVRPFEQAKETVRSTLELNAQSDNLKAHLDALKKKADIQWNAEAITRLYPARGLTTTTVPGAQPSK